MSRPFQAAAPQSSSSNAAAVIGEVSQQQSWSENHRFGSLPRQRLASRLSSSSPSLSPSLPPALPSPTSPTSPPATYGLQHHTPSPYHVGLVSISPLRQQFSFNSFNSSPTSSDWDRSLRGLDQNGHQALDDHHPDEEDLVVRRNKNALVQRLGYLVRRIVATPSRDIAVALHAKVDEIERAMAAPLLAPASAPAPAPAPALASTPSRPPLRGRPRPMSLDLGSGGETLNDLPRHSVRALSPAWFRSRLTDMSPLGQSMMTSAMGPPGLLRRASTSSAAPINTTSSPRTSLDAGAETQTIRAHGGLARGETEPRMVPAAEMEKMVAQVDVLNADLATLMRNLRARQEESDHIHALLVDRAERAAQRIIYLHKRVCDLEETLGENDLDLRNLRLQMKAIEVQCPLDLDAELRQSIENWKSDWARVRQKRSAGTLAKTGRVDDSWDNSGVASDRTMTLMSSTSTTTSAPVTPKSRVTIDRRL